MQTAASQSTTTTTTTTNRSIMPPNNRNRAHVVPTTAIRQKQQQQHPSQKSSMPPSRGGNVAVQKQQRPQDNNVSDKEKEVLRIFIPYFLADLKKSYETAVTIYKECKIKHEKRQQGYESLTAVMKVRLETDLLGKDQFKRKFGEFCKKHQTLLQQKLGNADPSTRGKEALRLFIPYFLQDLKKQYEGAVKIHRECKEKNERQEPGYESLTVAMKRRLGELVGKDALKQKFRNFVEKYKSKLQEKLGKGSSSSSNNKGVSVPAPAQAPAVIPVAPSQLTPKTNNSRQSASGGSTGKASSSKGSSSKKTSKPAASKKTSGSSTPSGASRKSPTTPKTPTSKSTPAKQTVQPEPSEPEDASPREYKELMALVDHAVDYDTTTAGLLLGPKNDLELTEEQQNLLQEFTPKNPPPPSTTEPVSGWDQRNVLSARAAWARINFPEDEINDFSEQEESQATPLDATESSASWVNEETAEQDAVFTMLSEGLQIYLKTVLEKGVHCARQRQNLDGIRLWHQHTSSTDTEKPALSLRLGCDVSRQLSQVAGNDAMTCKRMEEALERQSGVPSRARVLQDETLYEATSMGDLSLRPRLAKAVENAEYQGKRCFEMFGGKDASEPPFGRVPKQAKVEVIDLMMGSSLFDSVGRHSTSIGDNW